jgi:DNA polymerase-1
MRLLVDVSSIAYRAHYKLKFTDKDDNLTGVIYSLLRTIERLSVTYEPEEVILCFDGGNDARREMYPQYKANRKNKEARKEVRRQLAIFQSVAGTLPVVMIGEPGVEADDVIAVIAGFTKHEEIGIVTGDHDLYQLIDLPKHYVIEPTGKKRTQIVIEKYGIKLKPRYTVLFKSLVGDDSDNIKGVTGIGPVNANRLIKEVGGTFSTIKKHAKREGGLGKDDYKTVRDTLTRNQRLIALDGSLLTRDQYISILDQYRIGRLERRIDKKALTAELKRLSFSRFITRLSGFLIPFRKMVRERRNGATAEVCKADTKGSGFVRRIRKTA